MRVDVPWGTGTTPVEVEADRLAGVLDAGDGSAVKSANPEEMLRAALLGPGAGLDGFLDEAVSPLLIVVNDATRPTPSAEVLGIVRPALEEWAEPGRALAFIVATGTHRAALPEEVQSIFGRELAQAHAERIYCHDCRDERQLVHLGSTTRGTEIWANRLLAEAGSLIVINSVEPHYFAGYTGGRKSLFPGLAGYRTVWANHRLSMQASAATLVLAGNPVHEDLQEATTVGLRGKKVFSIQLVLDRERRVKFVAAGSFEDTFRRAVAVADEHLVLELDGPSEVVVAAAPHPMDCNFYQTNKAIQSGALAVKEGGVLIVVSECPFGLGENQTLFDLLASADSPAEAVARIDLEEYRLGAQQAARVAAILERTDIWTVTSLPDEDVRAMFMTPFSDVQTAVDAALAREGREARVLFLNEASITVPRVRSSGRRKGSVRREL